MRFLHNIVDLYIFRVRATGKGHDSMTKSTLNACLANLHPQFIAKDVTLAVEVLLDLLAAMQSNGGRIEIRGFGSFSLNCRPSRLVRNPRTG